MTIRNYRPEDREAVLELLRLNTPAYFAPSEEADLVYYLENESDHFYVMVSEDRPVGCGGINFSDDGATARISWDIFHPDLQGQGLGSRLTRFRIGRMSERESVHTLVVRTSQLAYTFYEKFGFETKEIVPDYWAKGYDLYRMERPAR